MFTGKTDEENRQILENYHKSDPRHARMIQWAMATPAGREMNLPLRNYMRDSQGQPTTSLDAFDERMKIDKELDQAPPTLKSFNELHNRAANYQRGIEELQMRGQSTAARETQLETTLRRIASQWQQIEKSEPLRNKWLDIEKMRNPQQAKVLQRDVEAGLRVEGIINTEPLLARFDNLHRITEEHERKKIKAARAGRHSAALRWSRYETSARSRLRLMQTRINRDNRLKEKWEEVEKLRRP